MIGILIVAHGAFGEALIHSASHVLGKRPMRVRQVGVTVHDDPEAILPQARDLVKQLDEGEGVLVLTDIYGATPGNIALKLLVPGRVEGISGVNLPMLVRALTYREKGLANVVEKALSGGTEGVVHMTTDTCGKDHAGRGETDHGGRDGKR
jgi:PTS system ascorbate-specific IIA component